MVEPGESVRVAWLDSSGTQLPGGCRRRMLPSDTRLTKRETAAQVQSMPTLALTEVEDILSARPVAMLLVHNQQLHSHIIEMAAMNNAMARTLADGQADILGECRRLLTQERQTDADLLGKVFSAIGDRHSAELEAAVLAAEVDRRDSTPDPMTEIGSLVREGSQLVTALRSGAKAVSIVPGLVGRMASGDPHALGHLKQAIDGLSPDQQRDFKAHLVKVL